MTSSKRVPSGSYWTKGQTVGRVARDLDLTESALRNWVDHARVDRTKGRTGLTSEEWEELRRLRKENRRLRVERDVLKKAVVSSVDAIVVASLSAGVMYPSVLRGVS